MKISFTRFSVVAVLGLQCLAAATVFLVGQSSEQVVRDFQASRTLPMLTEEALQLTHPLLLVALAAATVAIVLVAEVLLKSATHRFVVQMVDLSVWLIFTCVCVVAIQIPFLRLYAKLH